MSLRELPRHLMKCSFRRPALGFNRADVRLDFGDPRVPGHFHDLLDGVFNEFQIEIRTLFGRARLASDFVEFLDQLFVQQIVARNAKSTL